MITRKQALPLPLRPDWSWSSAGRVQVVEQGFHETRLGPQASRPWENCEPVGALSLKSESPRAYAGLRNADILLGQAKQSICPTNPGPPNQAEVKEEDDSDVENQ